MFSGHTDNSPLDPTLTTWNLVSWTLQIARRMEFLTSRKVRAAIKWATRHLNYWYYRFINVQVLHGDLAARNVLLADHGVVKVSDFGMARKMYGYYYEKKEEVDS